MPYKRKEKKSLLLYYDYLEQFELLDDKQFRKLIYTMIKFDRDGSEEKLDKMTTMAFVPIKRRLIDDKKKWEETCKINSENVKKRWEKERNTTVCESIRKDTNYTDIEKDIDIDKEIDKDIESENNIFAPTLFNILSFGNEKGIDEDYCKKFFNHYEAIGWVNGTGQKIKNWKLVFENWIKKDKKVNEEDDYVDEAGFHYRNGRRVL